MKHLIFLAAFAATASYGAEFLGVNPQGHWIFLYDGEKAACGHISAEYVTCVTETGRNFLCEHREPQEGYFANCELATSKPIES